MSTRTPTCPARIVRLLAVVLLCLVVLPARAAQDRPIDAPLKGETHELRRLELKEARVSEALRLLSEIANLNVVATSEASKREISLYLQNITAGQAVETLCKVAGLWYRRDQGTQTIRVMTTDEYRRDVVIYREDATRVFTLEHPNAVVIATTIEDLYGDRIELSLGLENDEVDDFEQTASSLGGFGAAGGSGFSRDVEGRDTSGNRFDDSRLAGRSRRNPNGDVNPDRFLDEELSADQLDQLDDRIASGEAMTSEDLRTVSRREPTIYITVNRQHNLIVVRTSDTDALSSIAALIDELDRPTPQVLLEMKILELTVGDGFRSIFDFSYVDGDFDSPPPDAIPANPLLPTVATAPDHVLGLGNFPFEGGTVIYQYLDDNIRARIQLLERDQRVTTLSTPVLLASNNRPARLFVGEERVLTVGARTDTITPATGATSTSIEPITEIRDIGNTLVIIPKINSDRTVTLFLTQDTSTVNENATTIPVGTDDGEVIEYPIDSVNTATMQATVVAKDDKTLAIGGLIRVQTSDFEEKVPILGDIPGLGILFKKVVKEKRESELLLLIRPRVLFTPQEAEEASKARADALSRHPWLEEGDGWMRDHDISWKDAVLPEEKDEETGDVEPDFGDQRAEEKERAEARKRAGEEAAREIARKDAEAKAKKENAE